MIWLHGVLALLSLGLGALLALHHPLWSTGLCAAFLIWCIAVYARPALWLAVLPACLPIAGFSPWTGWIGVEEFDLLVLGAAAGTHGLLAVQRWCAVRRARATGQVGAWSCPESRALAGTDAAGDTARQRQAMIVLVLLTVSYVFAMARGLADAGGLALGWFQAYEEPLNSLRVAKGFLWVMLLLPSLRRLLQCDPAGAMRCLAGGVAIGLGCVALAIVRERAGFPGLLDFSTPYRATALFWEMHVGGAALDAFLALAVPFAVLAVRRAPTPWCWVFAAVLAVLSAYACLTTFSRAVYLAVGLSLFILACLLTPVAWWPGHTVQVRGPVHGGWENELWRRRANRALAILLCVELLAVLGLGDFMGARLAAGERDFVGRLEHWREGLSLLDGPADLVFGRGSGRFPADYSHQVPGRAIPGRLRLMDDGEDRHLALLGTYHRWPQRGRFELLQRLPAPVAGEYTLSMAVRAPQPVRLIVGLCRKHLLYAASCAEALAFVPVGDGGWHRLSLSLTAGQVSLSPWQVAVPEFFSLRLLGPGEVVELDDLSLIDADGRQLLRNGDFANGLAHWFFAARHYFLPWHVDSLYFELLIDQGVVGLSLLLLLVLLAVANLLRGPGAKHAAAPYLLAALFGCLVVGAFSSLLDMPRPAFLFHLLLCSALFLGPCFRDPPERAPRRSRKGREDGPAVYNQATPALLKKKKYLI